MILIVCNSQDTILFWRRHLFAEGLPSVAISYRGALTGQFDSGLYDAAFIPLSSEDSKPPRFCYSFRIRYPNIPTLVFQADGKELTKDMREADILLKGNHTPHHFISKMLFEISAFHKRDICDCIRGIYRDHLMKPYPTICDTPFHLTPIERMIFRYLLFTYPRPVTAAELHRNCMKPGTSPSLRNIFSHIYRINHKSRQLVGFPSIAKGGQSSYRLNIPE